MKQNQRNAPLKESTGIIVGETVNSLVAYEIHKMTLKEDEYLQWMHQINLKFLYLNKDVTISVKIKLFKSFIAQIFLYIFEL